LIVRRRRVHVSRSPDDIGHLTAELGLDPERMPHHVAIIMDGNGRWARKRGLPRVAGHAAARASVRDVVAACAELGIAELTLYTFSVENWSRPRSEVAALMRLLDETLREQVDEMNRDNIRLNAMGRLDRLPKYARTRLDSAIARLSANDGLRLNLAISYGGRAEIIDAVRSIVDDARRGRLSEADIDEELLRDRLYTPDLPDPDLLIRTSGELRISNFLLWQIAYSELYVTDVLWPDFRRSHLYEALKDYQKRERRFGGIGSSPSSGPTR
jgi:undecaprenyl diphosphate synthase